MITETGRVVAIQPDSIWVETIRQSSCQSCEIKKGCGHGLLNSAGKERANHLRVSLSGLDANQFAINDQVSLGIPENLLVSAALLVYLLPLVTLLLGALVVSVWWSGDVAAMVGALLGFILGFLVIKGHALWYRDSPVMQPQLIVEPQSTKTGSSIEQIPLAQAE